MSEERQSKLDRKDEVVGRGIGGETVEVRKTEIVEVEVGVEGEAETEILGTVQRRRLSGKYDGGTGDCKERTGLR